MRGMVANPDRLWSMLGNGSGLQWLFLETY